MKLPRSIKNIPDLKSIFIDSVWTFRGRVMYALFQGIFYIILARLLGVEGFGVFAGVLAFINFFTPFLGLGSDSLLIRNISRQPADYGASLGRALGFYLWSGIFIALVLFLINHILFSDPFAFRLFLAFVAAEFLYRFSELFGKISQGFENLKEAANLWLFGSFMKLVAVLGFWAMGSGDVETWAIWYLFASMIVFGGSALFIYRRYGGVNRSPLSEFQQMKPGEGFAFSFTTATEKVYSDVDKFMLLKLASSQAAGVYAGAYQFIKLVNYPMQAILTAAYPRFFKRGETGVKKGLALSRRLLPYTALVGLIGSLSLWTMAPLVPVLLGSEYQEAVSVLRWLAVVPFIQSLYVVLADAFSGSGHQKLRSQLQFMAVVLNVGLNIVLIPIYSWYGAVIATLASEVVLLISFITAVILLSRKS